MFKVVKDMYLQRKQLELAQSDSVDMIRTYQRVFNTDDGRIVLNDIMMLCGYGQVNIGATPEETYFKLGEQNIAVEIAQRLNADLLEIEKMEKENG